MEAATEALDWRLVEGAKDETSLKPLVEEVDKVMDLYGAAIRPIRALFNVTLSAFPCGFDSIMNTVLSYACVQLYLRLSRRRTRMVQERSQRARTPREEPSAWGHSLSFGVALPTTCELSRVLWIHFGHDP